MSVYDQKHDEALLSSPWLSKRTKAGSWLIKYAPHPERAGYVFMATDLCVLLFESLTAPSIPSRLTTLSSSRTKSPSQRNVESTEAQAESTLQSLQSIMMPGDKWDSTVLEVKEHGFYDKVFTIRSGSLKWAFNTAELKSHEPMAVVSRHLVGPLASLLASARSIATEQGASTVVELVGSLLHHRQTADDILDWTRSQVALTQSGGTTTQGIPASEDDGEEEYNSPSPTARTKAVESTYRSPSPAPADEYTSPTPAQRIPESVQDGDEEYHSPSPSSLRAPAVEPLSLSPTPAQEPAQEPEAEPAQEVEEEAEAEPVPEPPQSSPPKESSPPQAPPPRHPEASSPPRPTPTQTSQKTKREREKEEEEEVERRREEMKRRMGAGAGGRLNKRRLARR